jgi:hypothetical protein
MMCISTISEMKHLAMQYTDWKAVVSALCAASGVEEPDTTHLIYKNGSDYMCMYGCMYVCMYVCMFVQG